jgi:hypothetical protein
VATLGALFSVIGVVTFVRRRRRRSIRNSIGASSSTSLIGIEPQVTVTPFYMAPPETMERDPESWMTGPQSQSMSLGSYDDAGASGSSSAPAPLPLSVPPMVPGLSSKELARLRAEALARSSNQSHSESSGSGSVTAPTRQRSMASQADARGLRSEVENLRREMDRLREERLEAPPSYASQVGDA